MFLGLPDADDVQGSFLTYGVEHHDTNERVDIKVCNPTNSAIDDGITRFNLLVTHA